jgi:hypothetical protein
VQEGDVAARDIGDAIGLNASDSSKANVAEQRMGI